MHNKKYWLIALLFLFVGIVIFGVLFQTRRSKNTLSLQGTQKENDSTSARKSNEKTFMLEGYPLQDVPLYKSMSVSSIKYFVNDDPASFADYFGKPVNYYNVVFETEANPEELLEYYRSLMTETNEEFVPEDQVQGRIGKYRVSASHYGNNPKNYAYLQVYLPAEEYQEKNRYYQEYPNVVEIQPNWVEHETSFGYLNQKGGEVEYTQYFAMPENIDQQIKEFETKYQSSPEYSFNSETGDMTWKNGVWKINLSFSHDHGRVYLMMRKPMDTQP